MTESAREQQTLDDVDHHSEYFREHNYEIYDGLRQRCPVAHSSAWGGFWMFTSYDIAFSAVQATDVFSSAPQKAIPMASDAAFIPIDTDPPELQQYRGIVLPWFSPTTAKESEARFRRMADELIDDFIEDGQADLIEQLTTPLPAIWMLNLLGFDEKISWKQWVEWIHTVVHDRSANPEKAGDAIVNIYTNLAREIERRRVEGFGDDLFSTIMQGSVDDEPLSDSQLTSFGFQLLLGGLDTTSGLTGNALVELDRRRDLRDRLMDEPEVMRSATEEFLRHSTPVQCVYRILVNDVEFGGQQLRKGDRVAVFYAAANRDPEVFDEPGELDFDRTPNRHLAFGVGPHRCLGSNHARVMFRVMISTILERLPDYTICGEVERFPDAGDVFAVRHLPVSFTPGRHVYARK